MLLICSCSWPRLLWTDTPWLIACREWLPFNSNCRGALDRGQPGCRGGGRHRSEAISDAVGNQGVVGRLSRLYVLGNGVAGAYHLLFWHRTEGGRLALTSLGLMAPSSLCMSQDPGSAEPLPGLNLNHSASGRRVGVLPCHTSVMCNECDVGGDSRMIQALWGAPACCTRWWAKESSKAR